MDGVRKKKKNGSSRTSISTKTPPSQILEIQYLNLFGGWSQTVATSIFDEILLNVTKPIPDLSLFGDSLNLIYRNSARGIVIIGRIALLSMTFLSGETACHICVLRHPLPLRRASYLGLSRRLSQEQESNFFAICEPRQHAPQSWIGLCSQMRPQTRHVWVLLGMGACYPLFAPRCWFRVARLRRWAGIHRRERALGRILAS